jgi:hypothetical protein
MLLQEIDISQSQRKNTVNAQKGYASKMNTKTREGSGVTHLLGQVRWDANLRPAHRSSTRCRFCRPLRMQK